MQGGWEDERDLAVVQSGLLDDDEVKDAWDAEDDDAGADTGADAKKKAPPKASKTAARAEPEATAEESAEARKARLEALVRENDLESAHSLFGVDRAPCAASARTPAPASASASLFDTLVPTTAGEFEQLSRVVCKRLQALEGSKHYPHFLEGLVHALVAQRDVPEIRKVAGVLSDLAGQKIREKQAAAGKAKAAPPQLKGTKKSTKVYDDMDDYLEGDGFDE